MSVKSNTSGNDVTATPTSRSGLRRLARIIMPGSLGSMDGRPGSPASINGSITESGFRFRKSLSPSSRVTRDSEISKNSEVVKRGCLYVKRPPSNNPMDKMRSGIKTWQKRYLVLRDTWTDEGSTVLELYGTEAVATCSTTTVQQQQQQQWASTDQYSINLRTVAQVDLYKQSKTFSHAFIVHRSDKSPLVFGAKTELEMREWLMAIKLLADKVNHGRNSLDGNSTAHIPSGPASVHSRSMSSSDGGGGGRSGAHCPPSVSDLERATLPRRPTIEATPSPRLLQTADRDDVTRRSSPQLVTTPFVTATRPAGAKISGSPQVGHRANGGKMQILRLPPERTTQQNGNIEVKTEVKTEVKGSKKTSLTPNDAASSGDVSRTFVMKVQSTPDSSQRGLTGHVTLTVLSDVITVCRGQAPCDKDVVLRWPLMYIRKLKSESTADGQGDLVTLQATSQAGDSEGLYQFRIECGWELIRCVRNASSELDKRICTFKKNIAETSLVNQSFNVTSKRCTQSKLISASSAENILESMMTHKRARGVHPAPEISVMSSSVTSSTSRVSVTSSSSDLVTSGSHNNSVSNLLSGITAADKDDGKSKRIVSTSQRDHVTKTSSADTSVTPHRGQRSLLGVREVDSRLSQSTGCLTQCGFISAGSTDQLTRGKRNVSAENGSQESDPEPPKPPPRPQHTIPIVEPTR